MHATLKVMKLATRVTTLKYATEGSSGLDLEAWFPRPLDGHYLYPGNIVSIRTGLAIELRRGWEGQVRSRSGLSTQHGIQVINAPGTIDSDYRGEIMIPLVNLGQHPYFIRRGARIAQLVVSPVLRVEVSVVDELSDTPRGTGGFGSTGT